ncbi:MAG: tetratricopeptide repeat protein, partial [Chitinophagaceae bacterium]
MRKMLIFLCVGVSIFRLNAQVSNPVDTIEYARSKAYEKNFAEADRLLTVYSLTHSDINALRLHAQVLYWMKNFNRSAEVFEKTLAVFPDVQVVKLDYGRMLFETGKLSHSQVLLEDYKLHDPGNAEVNILLA